MSKWFFFVMSAGWLVTDVLHLLAGDGLGFSHVMFWLNVCAFSIMHKLDERES